jgi:DnaJ-class molecular chaperone
MAKRFASAISKKPSDNCAACHGFGAVRMTAHFHTGDREFEAPCWCCFGREMKFDLPDPRTTDNG